MNETYFKIAISAIGTSIAALLGGWDIALKLLMFVMVLDFVSGFLVGIKNKAIDSNIMFWGGIRKAGILTIIILAVMLDDLIGNASPVFRTMVIFYFIGMEGISMIENYGKLGLPFPSKLEEFFRQLKDGNKYKEKIEKDINAKTKNKEL